MKPVQVPFAAPDISRSDRRQVAKVMASGWLTTGPKAKECEDCMSTVTMTNHALLTSSLTGGIPILLDQLEVTKKDNKLAAFPAWTFSSVPMEFAHAGYTIQLEDIERHTLMLPADYVNESADVIVPTHFAGNMFDVLRLKRANTAATVIDDAAHLIPGQKNGQEGALATLWSFYATKPVCGGEGGMITLNREQVAQRITQARLHGFGSDAFERHTRPSSTMYDVVRPGWKANIQETSATLILSQLARASKMAQRRADILRVYEDHLAPLGVRFLSHTQFGASSYHLAVIWLPDSVDRDTIREDLKTAGVGTSVHFTPIYRLTYWCEKLYGQKPHNFVASGEAKERFPNCEWAFKNIMSLPLSSAMTDRQVEYTVYALKKLLAK